MGSPMPPKDFIIFPRHLGSRSQFFSRGSRYCWQSMLHVSLSLAGMRDLEAIVVEEPGMPSPPIAARPRSPQYQA